MTNRIKVLTVVLNRDIRDDDIHHVVNAIQQLRDVGSVTEEQFDNSSYYAGQMDTNKLWREKIYELLKI